MASGKKSVRVEIGCSGFVYKHWKGDFYPAELPQRKWLEYYAEKFDTVELNITFYRLPRESVFAGWHERTPPGFKFVLKGSKLITHWKRLAGVEDAVSELVGRGRLLKDKLGLILWQLPPGDQMEFERLESFVRLLKKTAPGLRQAFEFRNPSWFMPEVYDLLREADMTFCYADWPQGLSELPDDFPYLYIRRHGPAGQAYRGSYSEKHLAELAQSLKNWRGQAKDVYVYFNNDLGGHAPRNALRLKELLGRA